MDLPLFNTAAMVFMACLAIALVTWCLAGKVIKGIVAGWRSKCVANLNREILNRLAIFFGVPGSAPAPSAPWLPTQLVQFMGTSAGGLVLLALWVCLTFQGIVFWAMLSAPVLGLVTTCLTALSLLRVVIYARDDETFLNVLATLTLAFLFWGLWMTPAGSSLLEWLDIQGQATRNDVSFYLSWVLAPVIVIVGRLTHWWQDLRKSLCILIPAAWVSSVAAGWPNWNGAQVNWGALVIAILIILAVWNTWRQRHQRGEESVSIKLLFCFVLGYAGFVSIYALAMIDRDLGLFLPLGTSKPLAYLQMLVETTLHQIPVVGALIRQAWEVVLPPNAPGVAPMVTDIALTKIVKCWIAALATLLTVSGAIAVVLAGRKAGVSLFRKRVTKAVNDEAFAQAETLAAEARTGGDAYIWAAIDVADKAISARPQAQEFEAVFDWQFKGLMGPLLGHLAASNEGDECGRRGHVVRRGFLNHGGYIVREHLYARTRLYWPMLRSHLAVTPPGSLSRCLEQLREAAAEWQVRRAPGLLAGMMNLLGVELSKAVAEQWGEDMRRLAQFKDELVEAAGHLQKAQEIFEGMISPIDAAAVSHNQGLVEMMLARLSHDEVRANAALRHFDDALRIRDGEFPSGDALEMDAAATHLFVALTLGLRARISGDRSSAVRILQHMELSTEIYGRNAGRLVHARENLVIASIHAANLAIFLDHWLVARDHLNRALEHAGRAELRGAPNYKFGILVRRSFVTLRMVQVELESGQAGVRATGERARRWLDHATDDIRSLVERAALQARVDPGSIEAMRDIRTILHLAAYRGWMKMELGLSLVDEETSPSRCVQDIQQALAESFRWGQRIKGNQVVAGNPDDIIAVVQPLLEC